MTEPVLDARLHHRPGLPAAVWVEPSREQWFWVRHFRPWFAPRPDEERGLVRYVARFLVVPSTNVTNFSLQYQSYLNDIFHRTVLARVAHFTCMPLITGLYLAALQPLHLGNVDGSLLGAGLLAVWWLAWALHERLPVWGGLSVLWAGAILAGSRAFVATGQSPWPWLGLLALVQASSHLAEVHVPPRLSGTARWMSRTEWMRTAGEPLPVRLRRWLAILEGAVHGTVDEAMASPRLAPIQLLEVLWKLGYAPHLRAEWKAWSQRAWQSGNPALDYIGTGGGTTLRWPGAEDRHESEAA